MSWLYLYGKARARTADETSGKTRKAQGCALAVYR
jgi:hypothetical protein